MATVLLVAARLKSTPKQRERLERLVELACARGMDVRLIPDPYHLPDDSPLWPELAALEKATLAGWQHPRPLEWLLRQHGVDAAGWRLHHLGESEPEAILADVDAGPAPTTPSPAPVPAPETSRWYPVIDYSRCVSCGHCADFCLFGVYTLEDARVRVTNPDLCKPGCPACSRICSESAIMFPLYTREPGIAGAPGQLVARDAASRRMYYERTGKTCPTCSAMSPEQLAEIADNGCCPECGRELQTSAVLAEIDNLIDRLDRLAGGSDD